MSEAEMVIQIVWCAILTLNVYIVCETIEKVAKIIASIYGGEEDDE